MSYLKALYRELDFKSGDLLAATGQPSSSHNQSDWLEKGEWLSAAKLAGAEKVYFINNNPIAIFAESEEGLENKIKMFNRIWCLARPRLLFLSTPGELTVYDLAQEPIDEKNIKEYRKLKHLKIVNDITLVAKQLKSFHRNHLDSGSLFSDSRFGDLRNRADKALIRDLKTVRKELLEAGLNGKNTKYAHALIGRSIFIRYLEDRGVLTEKYFRNIACRRSGWTNYLNQPQNRNGLDLSGDNVYYPRILTDKDFTYELFRQLAIDFNGDMFAESNLEEEAKIVSQQHLVKIQDLLYGDVGKQKQLFFFSYHFDIVPIDLISSIYEEFYHSTTIAKEKKSKARQDGAYYTPPALAEFVVSRVLNKNSLRKKPRVLDPACGSGIFLVEAFRRIVRYNWFKNKRSLSFDEMRTILKDQIAGIEVNPEAAKIAAFSLYLALLHYLEPPAITEIKNRKEKLPHLLASDSRGQNHFHSILPISAFDQKSIEENPLLKDRFGDNCADIIVGNPPWGNPGKKADSETKRRHQEMLEWCNSHKKPIGDKEPCQAFLWRVENFLKPKAKASMLVPAGILFKHHPKTHSFRGKWLSQSCLEEIVNFTLVRKLFFEGGDSPFLAIRFSNNLQEDRPVTHWNARQIIAIGKTQSVVLSVHDRTLIMNKDLNDSSFWKQMFVGGSLDHNMISELKHCHSLLLDFVDREKVGQGFKLSPPQIPAPELSSLPYLPIQQFSRYDKLSGFTSSPNKVYRKGNVNAYRGNRILIKRGISERGDIKGQIVCRYSSEAFVFSSALIGLSLLRNNPCEYKLLLGILWSSFARYYFFMISSTWGIWHHEIDIDDELLQFPVVLDLNHYAAKKIIKTVDNLRNYHPKERTLLNPKGQTPAQIKSQRRRWEKQLDKDVFDLYGLSEEQRDLVRDCCDVTLPFFYKHFDSLGIEKAINEDNDTLWMEQYINIFANRWKPYLGNKKEMRAELHIGAHDNMVAVEFYPTDNDDPWEMQPKYDWEIFLEQIGDNLPRRMGSSQIILDGLVHCVTNDSVIIIKRNIKRLWTRSLAREDADSTITKHMLNLQKKKGGS